MSSATDRATALERGLINGIGLLQAPRVYPDEWQPRLSVYLPRGIHPCQPLHNVRSPVRRCSPGPLQILPVLQGRLQVGAGEGVHGPGHLHGLQQLTLLRRGADHGADAQPRAREYLGPRLDQEHVYVLPRHPLHETRADALGMPVRARPEEHGLVDDDPRARRAVLGDPRLQVGPLQEVPGRVVRIHKADKRGLAEPVGLGPLVVLAGALVLPVHDVGEGAEAVGSRRRRPGEKVDQLAGSVAEEQTLLRLRGPVRAQERGGQPLQLRVRPAGVMRHSWGGGKLLGRALVILVQDCLDVTAAWGDPSNLDVVHQLAHGLQCNRDRAERIRGDGEVTRQPRQAVDVVAAVHLAGGAGPRAAHELPLEPALGPLLRCSGLPGLARPCGTAPQRRRRGEPP
mmetsp:Transcript_105432/g.286272  ORF Transcript_105432/g.286272 Transcript_105432/m.286272 type:complete len:399 (+) Transcript_105432:825-2021(+)